MPRFIYLDSGVILAYIKQEVDRASIIETELLKATEGRSPYTFVTSCLSLTEVAYIESMIETLQPEHDLIDDFWNSAPVQLVEVNEVNARLARELLRSRAKAQTNPQIALAKKRAADALHLATAMQLNALEFWTYDVSDLLKYSVEGITICPPHTDQLALPMPYSE